MIVFRSVTDEEVIHVFRVLKGQLNLNVDWLFCKQEKNGQTEDYLRLNSENVKPFR